MIAIEKSGTIQTFTRLPNEWNDDKGYHINFRKITNKEDYGFYDVVTPEHDKVTQQLSQIFWDADNKVFTYTVSNIDFDATYTIEVEEKRPTTFYSEKVIKGLTKKLEMVKELKGVI